MESPIKANAAVQEGNDVDFVWEDYLEDTNSIAAPPTAFSHVEYSLESGFKVGMKLEISSSEDCSTYWIATVIMTCGELLSLRYTGYGEDRSADFWFNIKSGEFHPVGWCSANNKKLWPPRGVLEKCKDINSLIANELKNVDTTSSSLSEDIVSSFMPIDQIKVGMKLEVLEEYNPQCIWIATIEQNVGGRLLLRYDGISESEHDFWLFYLSDRLQVIGYGKQFNLEYSPPKSLKSLDIWDIILDNSLKDAEKMPFPAHIFEPKIPVEKHEFQENVKLEAVNPENYTIYPATVSKVINDYYFIVTIDDHVTENPIQLCCHSNSPFIFPINWAEENGLEIQTPRGYENEGKFSWGNYLKFCIKEAAPTEHFLMGCMNMGFENGMKCEAADPSSPNIIKAATIVNIIEPLMWLKFDSDNDENRTIITSIASMDIYPVGWCGSNSYPLQIPKSYQPKAKTNPSPVKEPQDEKSSQVLSSLQIPVEIHGKSWCPKIYFNHRCFTGPLLSKSRLAELPQAIGPGPVSLVLHEVISRVVNIAYKSSQVLQILQTTGKCNPALQQQVIKAKYKGKSYRAIIEIVRNSEQVESFCKKICTKLECCQNLFGPLDIKDVCPNNCHTQTKTKFEVVKRGPGRKKKRKHWTHLLQSAQKRFLMKHSDTSENNESQKDDSAEKLDKKEMDKLSEEDTERMDEQDEYQKYNKTYDTNKAVHNKDEFQKYDKRSEGLLGENGESQAAKTHTVGRKKMKHTQSSSIVTRGAKLPNFGLWHHMSSFHARRGRPRTRPIPFPVITGRKVGRPVGSTKKAIAAAAQLRAKRLLEIENELSTFTERKEISIPRKVPKIESSPLDWSVEEVVKYIQKTECAPLAPLMKDQEIDGQAFLMLTKNNVQEYLHLKPEPAEQFCHLVKCLKLEYFSTYAT